VVGEVVKVAERDPGEAMIANGHVGKYNCRLFRSIGQIDADAWNALRRAQGDPFLDPRFLAAVEVSLGDSLRLWYAVIRDRSERPAAIACLCASQIDAAPMLQERRPRMARFLERVAPRALKIDVLSCGLPIASGESFLRLAPEADAAGVLAELDRTMLRVAVEERARCIAVREFDAEGGCLLSPLEGLGYARLDVPPMNRTRGGFRDFDDYLARLNCDHRRHIKRSQRKFAPSGLRVLQMRGGEEALRMLTPETYGLYEDVCRRHGWFEKLPLAYFRELAARLPEETTFTFICDGPRVVAFAMCMGADAVYHAMFCGFDYRLNAQYDLYFNLFFHIMDDAYRRGVSEIYCGKTSDTFKHRRLSCFQEPRWWYVKGVRRLAGWFIRSQARRFSMVP